MAEPTNRDSDKFMLRLPDGLRDRIKKNADFNLRSMNAEIVATLLHSYPEPRDPDSEQIAEAFLLLPKETQTDFINNWLQKNVSQKDIDDGLIPGVRSTKK
jgi:hypothetical protein